MMNPAAENLTGWGEEEALGHALEQVCRVQKDSGEAVDLMSCLLAEPVYSNRLRNFVVVDRSGQNQAVTWTISPVSNNESVLVGATLVLEKSEES
jgi:PAS domain S-box-containing protein